MISRIIRRKNHPHIKPHHIWTYLYVEGEFNQAEHDHILECDHCLYVFSLCLKSKSFGAVLKQLDVQADAERRSA
jgi:hypothetical protein